MSERNKAIIAYLRDTGATYGEAARHFKVSRNVVAGVCHRAGFVIGGLNGTAFHRQRVKRGMAAMSPPQRQARADAIRASWTPERRAAQRKLMLELLGCA